jgi:hypothetical protein
MEGKAILMEELIKGVIKELSVDTIKAVHLLELFGFICRRSLLFSRSDLLYHFRLGKALVFYGGRQGLLKIPRAPGVFEGRIPGFYLRGALLARAV